MASLSSGTLTALCNYPNPLLSQEVPAELAVDLLVIGHVRNTPPPSRGSLESVDYELLTGIFLIPNWL